MEAGEAFVIGHGGHLRIVISDPITHPSQVVFVSVTTIRNSRKDDPSCLLSVGDHPFISHASFIGYEYAQHKSNDELESLVSSGRIIMSPNVSPQLLQRIRDGACVTDRMTIEIADILTSQGIIS